MDDAWLTTRRGLGPAPPIRRNRSGVDGVVLGLEHGEVDRDGRVGDGDRRVGAETPEDRRRRWGGPPSGSGSGTAREAERSGPEGSGVARRPAQG